MFILFFVVDILLVYQKCITAVKDTGRGLKHAKVGAGLYFLQA